jgi:hypothetical protein
MKVGEDMNKDEAVALALDMEQSSRNVVITRFEVEPGDNYVIHYVFARSNIEFPIHSRDEWIDRIRRNLLAEEASKEFVERRK